MTPEALERYKAGVFPRMDELSPLDLFYMLPPGLRMEYLDFCYRDANRMMSDPGFRELASRKTAELQNECQF